MLFIKSPIHNLVLCLDFGILGQHQCEVFYDAETLAPSRVRLVQTAPGKTLSIQACLGSHDLLHLIPKEQQTRLQESIRLSALALLAPKTPA